MIKKELLYCFVISLFLFACTSTSKAPSGIKGEFRQIDKNNDGFIGRKEANASSRQVLKNNFKKIDLNNDGQVSLSEYKKHKAKQ